MNCYPPLGTLTHPPRSIPDFIAFLDEAAPPSAVTLSLNPRRHDDQELAQAFTSFRSDLLGSRALTTWFSYAGTASLVETEADSRVLRIHGLDLDFFSHNFSPTTGELGAFEDFAREVLDHPRSEFAIQVRTPAEVTHDSLVECQTRHTPETGLDDSRLHRFSMAPDAASRALWLTGAFIPKRLSS